ALMNGVDLTRLETRAVQGTFQICDVGVHVHGLKKKSQPKLTKVGARIANSIRSSSFPTSCPASLSPSADSSPKRTADLTPFSHLAMIAATILSDAPGVIGTGCQASRHPQKRNLTGMMGF